MPVIALAVYAGSRTNIMIDRLLALSSKTLRQVGENQVALRLQKVEIMPLACVGN
jgi:hypothetical protein